MRNIVAQIACELVSGCCAVHQHDCHSIPVSAICRAKAFITQRDLCPSSDARIGHVEAFDPDLG
ncbi:MAG TPA: hypothetical protein DIW46_08580 [Microbacterium sp.]|nr:hypothetical protein [Microbacterium sp.]